MQDDDIKGQKKTGGQDDSAMDKAGSDGRAPSSAAAPPSSAASSSGASSRPKPKYDTGFENFQDFTILDDIPDVRPDDLYMAKAQDAMRGGKREKSEVHNEDWSNVKVGGMDFSQNRNEAGSGAGAKNVDQKTAAPIEGDIVYDRPAKDSGSGSVGAGVDDVLELEVDIVEIDPETGEATQARAINRDTQSRAHDSARHATHSNAIEMPDGPVEREDVSSEALDSGDDVQARASASAGEVVPVRHRAGQDHGGGAQGAIARRHSEIKLKAEQAREGMEAGEGKKGRIGERLVSMGLITADQLNVALQEKKITGRLIGEVLVDLGFIDEETLTAVLAEMAGFDVFDPKHTIVDGDALALIEKKTAMKYMVLPLSLDDQYVYIAMSDPYDVLAMDAIRQFVPRGLQVRPVVTTASVISEAIDTAYGYSSSINEIMKELDSGVHQDVASLKDNELYSHPIVRLVNALLVDAVKMGVSDLHFEPEENFVRLRYRLDGVLFTAQILHKQYWNGISQRIKLLAEMNIADKLSPQDGRFGINAGGKDVDFRVSSLPTVHGENIVLRVLDKSQSIMPLAKLGFSPENLKKIKTSQTKPEGIIIVTGPTGSGKSTSLYSMLNEINNVEINIQTLEDPVEYSLPMIRQTHVREGVLEFADGIKALLRQDPDIIFIGEIRDQTTAEMALKAAMTGHQVYTTLHTNDSFGAIPRLLDLGLKPGMIAGAIIAIFAQRLTRVLCPNCKEAYKPNQEECRILSVNSSNPPTIYRAKQGGCEHCAGQGYKGRIAVAEILTFDEDMDELLARGESKAELKILAEKKGFKNMRDDGILKVLEGITDLQALSRVVDIYK